jgi:hypothetical protein
VDLYGKESGMYSCKEKLLYPKLLYYIQLVSVILIPNVMGIQSPLVLILRRKPQQIR